jgi:hypothetical protein
MEEKEQSTNIYDPGASPHMPPVGDWQTLAGREGGFGRCRLTA